MSKIRIVGGKPLKGKVEISGSKNAALPIMAASLLTDHPVTICNVPDLHDITTMSSLLQSLGATVERCNGVVSIDASNIKNTTAHVDIVSKMRASFLVLGPLLTRFKKAKVALPGGCSIGKRLVNYHLESLAKMGAVIEIKNRYVSACTTKTLKGCDIFLQLPSVGATENILMAAVLAEDETVINNAAIEPEVNDLVSCLLSMGAQIKGIGTRKLTVEGVKKLHGCEYKIIPDRIEAATYAIAAAITGSDIVLSNLNLSHLCSFIEVLKEIGVKVELTSNNSITVVGSLSNINATNITTDVHPAIATDFQSLFTSLLSIANGKSIIRETIFNNRFGHVAELNLMGAKITTKGDVAYVLGIKKLKGAKVKVTDLRAGAALVLAGLAAGGETIIEHVHHIDRGYDGLEKKLSWCGADIERVDV